MCNLISVLFNEDILASNMFIFFLAGFETTATTLSYCLYELALNQEIQDKLREEIKNEHDKHGGTIPFDDLKKLTYLEMVLSGMYSLINIYLMLKLVSYLLLLTLILRVK